jgi:signal transduction histidine kinase
VPKVGQLSNCEPVTKDTIWQRYGDIDAPAIGAMVFACLLCGVTIWFSGGAIGPWFALLGLGLALVTLVFDTGRTRRLLMPLLLGLSALALGLFGGGFTTIAACALLWPLLSAMALGEKPGIAFAASLSVFVLLVLSGTFVSLPANVGLASQSGILALGICGALSLAALGRRKLDSQGNTKPLQAELTQLTASRDAAVTDATAARAETVGRAKFMAEMSHEIRTPLNAILGFADTMREGVFGPLPAAYGDYPELIHTSGTHLLDLVSDLLDLSKIEAGRYETSLKPLKLDEIAYEGVRLSSGAARAAGVQIRHEASRTTLIHGDARALRQIVFNLMSNAIKFTPEGGRVSLRVLVDQATNMASLEVEDSGIGISPTDLAKIGEPWNQGSDDSANDAKKSRGSGLGLALVKRLTDLQGGKFDITSNLGEGTRARVSFPLAQPQPNPEISPQTGVTPPA